MKPLGRRLEKGDPREELWGSTIAVNVVYGGGSGIRKSEDGGITEKHG